MAGRQLVKVRDRGPDCPKALVIAYSVHETGRREVIGLEIGEIGTAQQLLEHRADYRGPRARARPRRRCRS
ncbi:MAG TPA: hypothetical protein VGO80_14040 [Solirubrobacteraceae bacterium]|jgi:transposase-like protein|nr:hypothetical protein [Solirubrobacteraceae bacterium]